MGFLLKYGRPILQLADYSSPNKYYRLRYCSRALSPHRAQPLPRYWSHVSKHFPKWKECRDWLKDTTINIY